MAKAVGKKVFKRHLDLFLRPLFDTLSRVTTSQLARHAAASCARQLSTFVGPSIFRGRLSDSQRQVGLRCTNGETLASFFVCNKKDKLSIELRNWYRLVPEAYSSQPHNTVTAA